MDYEKEISFGAFDSELMHQEIFIPEGFTATIEGDKIILKKTESEDERIRKALISILKSDFEKDTTIYDISVGDIIAWLEKQKKSTSMQNGIIINGVEYILIEDHEWCECERCALFEQCGNGENLICKSLFGNLSDKHRFKSVNK